MEKTSKYWVIVLVLSFFHFIANGQCPTCTLTGWSYVQEITIDNSAIATSYTNFQELIILDTQTPISLGKMNASGDDIYFLDSDCSTPLCYYIESGMNSTSTQIWVLLPSLAANSTKTIFMFYGNTAAPAASNFSCVFPSVLTVTGVVTLSGNQNYDWIDIQSGSSVNIWAGQVLSFKARKIIMAGNINGNNGGYGPASGPGAGQSGGGGKGGGGGGYGGIGGSGNGGNGGVAYGTATGTDIDMGSGGGGSDCAPSAAGGGAVEFEAAVVDIIGNISVNGQTAGNCCCGNSSEAAGAGSGGGILAYADYVNGSGSLNAIGGNGGNSDTKEGGGGGAGGRIKIFYSKANNYMGATNVTKGLPGSGGQSSPDDAQNGTSTVNTFISETVSIGPEQYIVNAVVGPDLAFCSGSSVTIGAASQTGYSYVWSPSTGLSNDTVSNPTVIVTNNGSANIVTDYVLAATSNSCTAYDTVQVTVYPLPTSTFTASGPVCVQDASVITYTGNAGTGATYLWDFDSAMVISGSGQGPYLISWDTSGTKTITLTVAQNGCISSTSTVITTVNPPNAYAGPDVTFCSGINATLGTSANAGYTYSWSPSTGLSSSTSANPTITLSNTTGVPVTTDYVVTTSFAGCTVSDTVTATVTPEPVSNAGPDASFCSGGSAVTGGTNNTAYTYAWSPSSGLSDSTVSSPTVSLTHTGQTPLVMTYVVTTTFAAYGCTTSDTAVVTVFQIPTSDFNAPADVCENQVAAITYTGNATTSASYTWNFAGGSASPGIGQGPHNVSWANAGTVNVTLQVSENTCTSAVTSFSITVKPTPVADAGADVSFCSGSNAVLGIAATPGYSYLWNPSTGLSNSTVSNPSVTLTNPSNAIQTFYYIVTSMENNCSMNDTVQVTVYPIPVADFISPVSQCLTGNSYSFAGNGTFLPAATFSWDFGPNATPQTSTDQNPSGVSFSASGIQTVSFTVVQYGCTSNVYVNTVLVNPMPLISYQPSENPGCQPLEVTFNDNTISALPSTYLWEFGDGIASTQQNPLHIFDTDGQFNVTVTVTSGDGCVSIDASTTIIVFPKPESVFEYRPQEISDLHPEVNFTDSSLGNITDWLWDLGDGVQAYLQNPSHTYADTGVYCVELIVTNSDGCLDTSVKCLRVMPSFILYAPNAFTPNDDGINDYFMPTGIGIDPYEFELFIFDRWGKIVYETDNLNNRWDGSFAGGEVIKQDVYVWLVKLKDVLRKEHEFIGHVTVLW